MPISLHPDVIKGRIHRVIHDTILQYTMCSEICVVMLRYIICVFQEENVSLIMLKSFIKSIMYCFQFLQTYLKDYSHMNSCAITQNVKQTQEKNSTATKQNSSWINTSAIKSESRKQIMAFGTNVSIRYDMRKYDASL